MTSLKQVRKASIVAALMALSVTPVIADGDETKTTEKEVCVTQYGGGTECTKETVTEVTKREEQIETHETVDAGLEDYNFIGLAGVLAGTGAVFYILSKITKQVYVLDN